MKPTKKRKRTNWQTQVSLTMIDIVIGLVEIIFEIFI